VRASAAEFILEGLYAHRRISRSEERGFSSEGRKPRENKEPRDRREEEDEFPPRERQRRKYN
jgi:magnesium chelatase subunit I